MCGSGALAGRKREKFVVEARLHLVRREVERDDVVQEALDGLARDQDRMMERLQRSNAQATCAPKLNPEKDAQYWFDQPGAPAAKLTDERGTPQTLDYDKLLASWKAIG